MADIFISYSQKDRSKAREVVALLEAEGYAVWWDSNLETAEDFSASIMRQLTLAKAVIVLWSENSVASKWVRAEAMIADKDEKLVPLRFGSLEHDRIHPPFNAYHTESTDNRDAVLKVVAKLVSRQPTFHSQFKHVYREGLVVFGVTGAAVTIFGNLQNFVELANWAKWISHYWHEMMFAVFEFIAQFIRIKFPKQLTGLLSFALFLISATVGTRMQFRGNLQVYKFSPDLAFRSAGAVFMMSLIVLPMAAFLYAGLSGINITQSWQTTLIVTTMSAAALSIFQVPVILLISGFKTARILSGWWLVMGVYFICLSVLFVFLLKDLNTAPTLGVSWH